MHFQFEEILRFALDLFVKLGVEDEDALAVSEGLCEASLRGVDSHGIRLLPHYVESLSEGRKNLSPNYSVFETYPAAISIDADNAMGLAAGRFAIKQGMLRAANFGICSISVKNSSHPGAMASIALFAAKRGFVCFAFTNADALVLPENGSRPFLGTNPICFAAPRRDEEPFCVDMAISKSPWNRVMLSKATGQTIPDGIAADASGKNTNDPNKAAALFPIGSYKGFALASMVEVLCGVMAGGPFGRGIPAMFNSSMSNGRELAQFYIVMKPDISISMDEYFDQINNFSKATRSEPSLSSHGILVPNDPQIATAADRLETGIPIDPVTLEALREIADKYEIDFPQPVSVS